MVTLLLLLALGWRAPASEPAPLPPVENSPFLLGVLRRDAVVTPFAAFDGKDWDNPWPADLRSLELPIDLESVPRKWWGKGGRLEPVTAWTDGVNRGPLQPSRLTMIRSMCATRLALVTDYKPQQPAPPPAVQPYPKDGLAVWGDQRVEPVVPLSAAAPGWTRAATLLPVPVAKAEDIAIGAFTGWDHPFSKAERRKAPVEIEAMYSAPMDEPGWTAYYIEAVKRYPLRPEDEGCGLITSVSGWIVAPPELSPSATTLVARVTYCDRRGVTYMLPLGLVKTRGRTYWAYQLSGYGREGYLIVRPTPKNIVHELNYSAGNCPF